MAPLAELEVNAEELAAVLNSQEEVEDRMNELGALVGGLQEAADESDSPCWEHLESRLDATLGGTQAGPNMDDEMVNFKRNQLEKNKLRG